MAELFFNPISLVLILLGCWFLYRKIRTRRSGESLAINPETQRSDAPNEQRFTFEHYTAAITAAMLGIFFVCGWLGARTGLGLFRWLAAAGELAVVGGFIYESVSARSYENAKKKSPAWTQRHWILLNLLFHVVIPVLITCAVVGVVYVMSK